MLQNRNTVTSHFFWVETGWCVLCSSMGFAHTTVRVTTTVQLEHERTRLRFREHACIDHYYWHKRFLQNSSIESWFVPSCQNLVSRIKERHKLFIEGRFPDYCKASLQTGSGFCPKSLSASPQEMINQSKRKKWFSSCRFFSQLVLISNGVHERPRKVNWKSLKSCHKNVAIRVKNWRKLPKL